MVIHVLKNEIAYTQIITGVCCFDFDPTGSSSSFLAVMQKVQQLCLEQGFSPINEARRTSKLDTLT
jgi:hypothetical protein